MPYWHQYWHRWSIAVLLALGLAGPALGAPAWPSLGAQLAADRVPPGSALERLIAANQDFSLLRPGEARDGRGIPLWLRVAWRKAHPRMRYPDTAADPTGGYPLLLEEVHEWMLSHPDLVPGLPELESGPERAAVESLEQRISGPQISPRSESDIRVNPWDPMKIVGGSNNISGSGAQAQFYSTDGGVTWSQTNLPLQADESFQGDPSVDWTSDGTAWAATIGIGPGASILQLRAYKSTNHGASWTFDATFSGSQTSADKEILWTDHSNTSPFKDNVYVIWHDGPPAYINRRTGPGGSWLAEPLQVSGAETTGTAIGSDVKTNAAGDVFGFWPDTGGRRLFVVKSTNGGASWGTPVRLANTFESFNIGLPAFNNRKALIYVSGGAWRTATKDLVYATWTDLTGAIGCNVSGPGSNTASACKTRIWFARSADGGATWSAPVMLNDQPSQNDQFNQSMTVDETSGELAVIYYDTVGDPGRTKTDVWYQSSFDDGATWSPAQKITSGQTDETTGGPDSGNQYGDYNALSGFAGVFFPSWTDRRANAREEVWTAKVSDPPCTFSGPPAIGAALVTGPNQVQVSWSDGTPSSAAWNVYRATGGCAAPGPFTRVAGPVAGLSYIDAAVSGGTTYAWQVRGLDASGGCESAPSACVQATATGACTLPPEFAGLAAATNQGASICGIALAWAAATPACAGPVTYDVFRSTSSGFAPGPGNRIAAGVSGGAYTDTAGLTGGASYFYKVRAVDASNGAADANAVERRGAATGPVATGTLSETFEGAASGGGFDNAGWSHGALSGGIDWVWSTGSTQTPVHLWFSASQTFASDRALVSSAFLPRAGTALSFWHTYAFETNDAGTACYDGGTLEISGDQGASWSVLPDAAFTAGGFNGTVGVSFSNPIGGKRAWCRGTFGAMTRVTADLSLFAGAGADAGGARLRWHAGDDSIAKAFGWSVDSVTVSGAGLPGVCTPGPAVPLDYFTAAPCRLVDTRNPDGPAGGPALQPSALRTFTVAGACGVPADAKAVAVNVTAVLPAGAGFLRLFPADQPAPATSTLNFVPGLTRSNNAILPLGGTGAVKVQNGSSGAVHLVLDVAGYFK